jgi:hypothetical protein
VTSRSWPRPPTRRSPSSSARADARLLRSSVTARPGRRPGATDAVPAVPCPTMGNKPLERRRG